MDKQENALENVSENEQLLTLSQNIFPSGGMILQVVKPTELVFLKSNARYLERETFRQLRDNIAADKSLSSVPLCYRYDDGRLEILSGNHRVKASIDAGIEKILVLIITVELDESKRIAIQLSHNSLVGQDEQSILAELWSRMDSVTDKLYSGHDSEQMKDFSEDIQLLNFSTPQISTQTISFLFTEGERDQLSLIMEELSDTAKKSKVVYVAPQEQYDNFMKIIQDIKGFEKIKDSSLAMFRITEIVREYLENSKALLETSKIGE